MFLKVSEYIEEVFLPGSCFILVKLAVDRIKLLKVRFLIEIGKLTSIVLVISVDVIRGHCPISGKRGGRQLRLLRFHIMWIAWNVLIASIFGNDCRIRSKRYTETRPLKLEMIITANSCLASIGKRSLIVFWKLMTGVPRVVPKCPTFKKCWKIFRNYFSRQLNIDLFSLSK